MPISIRMRYDGKVFIPEQPVDLPLNEPLDFEYVPPMPKLSPEEIARRRAAWGRTGARAVRGANIPAEALRRKNMEDLDRGL